VLWTRAFTSEKDAIIKDAKAPNPSQTVEKFKSSFSQYMFPWYVIAPGGGYTSSESHTMKFTSVGQVFADTAQSNSYKIHSGYISTPAPKPVEVKEEEKEKDQLPYTFELSQNYPNPFNPTTNIRFSLPKSGHARLDIYNILGRRVTTLVDEDLPAGHKLITWYGKDYQGNVVAGGVYFYSLKAGDFTETKKMILMK
jgi:hypothetical protein